MWSVYMNMNGLNESVSTPFMAVPRYIVIFTLMLKLITRTGISSNINKNMSWHEGPIIHQLPPASRVRFFRTAQDTLNQSDTQGHPREPRPTTE